MSLKMQGSTSLNPKLLLNLPLCYRENEGEFVTSLGGYECILDTGSMEIELHTKMVHKGVLQKNLLERIRFGSETLLCRPINCIVKSNDGINHQLRVNEIVQSSQPIRSTSPVGVLGLAVSVRTPLISGPLSENECLWSRLNVKERSGLKHSIWSLVPNASHVIYRFCQQSHGVEWWSALPPFLESMMGAKTYPIQYFNRISSSGELIQYMGWKENESKILFETGSTRTRSKLGVDCSPKPEIVLGNLSMINQNYWFDFDKSQVKIWR